MCEYMYIQIYLNVFSILDASGNLHAIPFPWKQFKPALTNHVSKARVEGYSRAGKDPLGITPGPCCPPLTALPSSLPWQPPAPPNSQQLPSRLWSAWTCGRGTGCCRRACGGHRARGSSDFPSERHCRGSICTGKAGDLSGFFLENQSLRIICQ